MNPFVSRINKSSWEIPVSALCLLLGFMVSMVWRGTTLICSALFLPAKNRMTATKANKPPTMAKQPHSGMAVSQFSK